MGQESFVTQMGRGDVLLGSTKQWNVCEVHLRQDGSGPHFDACSRLVVLRAEAMSHGPAAVFLPMEHSNDQSCQ